MVLETPYLSTVQFAARKLLLRVSKYRPCPGRMSASSSAKSHEKVLAHIKAQSNF